MKDFNKGVLQEHNRGRNQGSPYKQSESVIWAGNQAIGAVSGPSNKV